MLSQRLARLINDFHVTKDGTPNNQEKQIFTSYDRKVLVGPLHVNATGLSATLLRFGVEHNCEDQTIEYEKVVEGHPLFPMRTAAWGLGLKAISLASFAFGDDIDKLERCTHVDLALVCTPNFQHIGLAGEFVRRVFGVVFDNADLRPIVTTTSVSALPGGALFSATYEFLGLEP